MLDWKKLTRNAISILMSAKVDFAQSARSYVFKLSLVVAKYIKYTNPIKNLSKNCLLSVICGLLRFGCPVVVY